jgi:cation diffusion facilitator family transporter
MHHAASTRWQENHRHDFHAGNPAGERGTRWVVLLTACMMVAEIVIGWWTNSMALLADGWHMGTHVAALGIAAFAYWYARRHAGDPHFTFGTWKVGVLGGFASAIVLGIVALGVVYESIVHLVYQSPIEYDTAILTAVIGLAVNLWSAYLLQGHEHGHDHEEGHGHGHGHGHGQDLNLRAAYIHVLADAVTSLLAIVALVSAKFLGCPWLDPVMGLVGAAVIVSWAWGLLRQTTRILLDRAMDEPVVQEIREVIESDG